jgi:hypothetical protein
MRRRTQGRPHAAGCQRPDGARSARLTGGPQPPGYLSTFQRRNRCSWTWKTSAPPQRPVDRNEVVRRCSISLSGMAPPGMISGVRDWCSKFPLLSRLTTREKVITDWGAWMPVDIPSGQNHGEDIFGSIWHPEDQPTHVLVSILLYARIALTLLGMASIDLVERGIRMLCNKST